MRTDFKTTYILPFKMYYIIFVLGLSGLLILNLYDYKIGKIHIAEFLLFTIVHILFGYYFLSPSGKFSTFYYGDKKKHKKNNKTYSWLIYSVLQVMLILILHDLNNNQNNDYNIHFVLKLWETVSYLVIAFYNWWFWFNKERGKDIVNKHFKGDLGIILWIYGIVFVTIFLTFFHLLISISDKFCNDQTKEWLSAHEVTISLLLITTIYWSFARLDKIIFTNIKKKAKHEPNSVKFNIDVNITKRDFNTLYRYVDNPMKFIFLTLFVFSIYLDWINVIGKMEAFFSGAIGFELIFSSIIWANTDTV